jgi:hypothetical protein
VDNRPSYVSFGLALLIGYGAFALAHGDDPILPTPSAVPAVLLLGGLLMAVTITGVCMAKARRGARGREAVIDKMLAASWLVGFGALFLVITALSTACRSSSYTRFCGRVDPVSSSDCSISPGESPIAMSCSTGSAPGLP